MNPQTVSAGAGVAAGSQVEEVQLFGEALDAKKYRQWARRHGRAPELTPGTYALVLHAMAPAHVERFLRRNIYTELFGVRPLARRDVPPLR